MFYLTILFLLLDIPTDVRVREISNLDVLVHSFRQCRCEREVRKFRVFFFFGSKNTQQHLLHLSLFFILFYQFSWKQTNPAKRRREQQQKKKTKWGKTSGREIARSQYPFVHSLRYVNMCGNALSLESCVKQKKIYCRYTCLKCEPVKCSVVCSVSV